ncbi:glycoside hydrolase family 3 N-terminal domain-containing protein [Cytophagaceae bacterium ABcell3]|nr:glycoside hydrolase family 3 N-terminal domain-containing protein [Cytophagaceae bacterium ABcell3]
MNKNRRWSFRLFYVVFSTALLACSDKKGIADYKDANLPAEVRAEALLQEMTIEEKVAQLTCIWQDKVNMLHEDGSFNEEGAIKYFGGHSIGQIARPSEKKNARQMAEFTNKAQKFFTENTRLGIPVIFHEECLHGHAAPDGTSFPHPIALAGTFDPELVESLYRMTAKEVRLRGGHQALTPVVDIARDPRWGRVEETFGEDPYLVSRMGLASVIGFQGREKNIGKESVLATLKHFAAHGEPESGTNCAPANISERVLREVHLLPFKVCVEEGGVRSIMASYNEIDGIPSHVNHWLLKDVLRGEWGFDGTVVSDYYAIEELMTRHKVVGDKKSAAINALRAGVDMELPNPSCYNKLAEAVKENPELLKFIDAAVLRVLKLKFELGLFENPYVEPDAAEEFTGCEDNRKLALEAAKRSIVLLKNENNLAPIDRNSIKKLAVIGPNADKVLCGGYSDKPKQFISILQGIQEKVGKDIEVLYSEGCKITEDGNWYEAPVHLSDAAEDRKKIKEAVKIAQQADAVVLCVGGNELTSREAWDDSHMGDRNSLEMVGLQEELIKAVLETGKPVYTFLFNGRPLSINYLAEHAPVIFEAWYLGQETGYAVADVLFGDYNPGGKLAISIPRSVGHVPAYYNYKPTARRGYLFEDVSPLYPFGHGLSYTSFDISNLKTKVDKIHSGDSLHVSVDVVNTGYLAGDEVIQLYIRDVVSSVTRPVLELKDFQRISLEPGEKKNVSFYITPEKLAFYNLEMNFEVEPGEFEVMIGNSSTNLLTATFEVLAP